MQSGRKTLSLVEVALLATLASACIDSPRNGHILATKATTVDFEGWYPASNVEIKLWVWNKNTSAWAPLSHPTILTGTTGLTDNAGDTWYAYGANVVLPQDNQYWAAGPSRAVIAKIKATGPGPYDLTTYDGVSWTDDCIEQWKPVGGAAIMSHCKSVASPAVTLRAHCGNPSGTCCLESPACDFGKNCSSSASSGACSVTCGGLNQTCCQASPQCSGDTVCKNNSCVDCGSTGEACCPGNSCNPGNVCQGGSCVLCGGLNQPCCGGGTCPSSVLACTSGVCKVPACGGANQACCAGSDPCPGDTSAQPLTCNVVDKCVPCSNEHQACCNWDSNPPFGCSASLSCMSEPGGYQCECDYSVFPNGCG